MVIGDREYVHYPGICLQLFSPRTPRDWRTFGGFSTFVVTLFTEMYGFPLTICLLSGGLTSRFPEIDWFSKDSSHLMQKPCWGGAAIPMWAPAFGQQWIHREGLILLGEAWQVFYRVQRFGTPACNRPYAYIRHPKYVRLAKREEKEAEAILGEAIFDMTGRFLALSPGGVDRRSFASRSDPEGLS